MNANALTLLQGRLLYIALESDTHLQRLRENADAARLFSSPEWDNTALRSHCALIEFLERRLSTAVRALNRIEDGLFGLCEDCGRQIDQLHLFVQPDRPRCDACDRVHGGSELFSRRREGVLKMATTP